MDKQPRTLTPEQMAKMKKMGKFFGWIFGILLVVGLLFLLTFNWITDYIWLDNLGFGSVFTTILGSKMTLIVVGFVLFFIASFLTLQWIRSSYINHFHESQLPPFLAEKKLSRLIIVGTSFFVGILGSSVVQGLGWEPLLKFLQHEKFGITDPHFNMDISFYMFVLPFLEFIVYLILTLAILALLTVIGAYSVFHMYRLSKRAQLHIGVTIGLVGLMVAAIHFLQPYHTLLSNQVNIFQTSVVYGLSYTDELINIPKAYILAGVAIIAAVWTIISLYRGKIKSAIIPIAAYVVVLIVGQGASMIVQSFVVSPNEFQRESPYLERNLEFTRAAYDLDEIKEEEHPGNYSLDEAMVERNSLTIDNIRINDSRPLLDIYNQIQTFRTYYRFNDIDIDRYEIDGDYQQVFIGARELSTEDLPEQAQTWVNRNLRYTHGYGIAMSHVNEITSQGQPQYLQRNIPVEGTIDVTRPQIYFGEEEYNDVIVNTKVDEFDYPSGDENVSTRYEEEAGIQLTGLNRLLFAIDQGSFRFLVSDQLDSESRLLKTRNIMDRVQKIAPFFEYDSDPYIFIRDDGSLAWMMDVYLIAENYPYSEQFSGDSNYIRNSVKVVVDAYTGEVDFYIVEPDEPLVKTYQTIFPDLFTEEIPEDVQRHFRYPETLFKVQSEMYGTYHMSNLEVFYNREDFWQFATENYFDSDVVIEPYYITMKLPEYEEEEFILMVPYTPRNRQNMIAWMGVRNDGEHYGELFVYTFPKQRNIYGPQQIENRINQDSTISQQLNLWSQGGSEVIRGNLIAIPIEDTIMYVEPIYIESSNETSLPEVKQIIVAYEDHIVMETTLERAMESLFELMDPDAGTPPATDDGDPEELPEDEDSMPSIPLEGAEMILEQFSTLFDDYQEALSSGDWEEAGRIMAEIEEILATME
ncbi:MULTISPECIES: UPF0182 family membrane protein [unclassified Oceanobacillus]|uniref:UPF0182 family membrane protein n=1 Tax=unclassified Oceanobacillus TaxID=2630292 RepID=UPI00300E2CC7